MEEDTSEKLVMILKDMPRKIAALTLVQDNVTQIYTQHTQSQVILGNIQDTKTNRF